MANAACRSLVGPPATPRAGRLVGDERTRRAGLRCADVVIRAVFDRSAPKKAGT